MDKVLGRGEGFSWPGYLSARLPEEVDPGAIFPLRELDANLVLRQPGPPDAPVCGLHQSDGNPTLDVSVRPGVGLLPLCCEADDYPFQGSRCLHTQEPISGSDEGREVSEFLEARLQVYLLLRPLCLLDTLFWCLHQMGLGIYVHYAHVIFMFLKYACMG